MRTFCCLLLFFIYTLSAQSQQTKIRNANRIIPDTLGYDSVKQVFYPSGKLYFQVPYKNGTKNGWYEEFHENGAVAWKKLLINGKVADGYYIIYSESGSISQSGYYKNGYPIGKWVIYVLGKPSYLYYYNRNGSRVKVKKWNDTTKKWVREELM